MKRIFLLAIVAVLASLLALTSVGGQTVGSGAIRDRFVGAWRLAWLEEPEANGEVHRTDCTGMLVYTRDGHMSVQVMYLNPQAGGQAGPVQYAQAGYEASFGTYVIDERGRTFTFHVDGSMVRGLIGKDLPRVFEFSGGLLIVRSANPEERWRVAWERY